MSRTFNRPPLSVSTPSASDVKQYFFNHYNWKGLNDDKNFLAADQETFSNCDNIYVDSEGLLKSRPAEKIKVVKATLKSEIYKTAVDSEGEECPDTINPTEKYFTKPALRYDGQPVPQIGDYIVYDFDVANAAGYRKILCKILSIDRDPLEFGVYISPIKFVSLSEESSITVDDKEVVLADIVNTWVFEYVTVYQSKYLDDYYLTFVNSNTQQNTQVSLEDNAIKLIVADEKIFVFSETSLNYYDMRTNEYATADDFIHIPVVKVITNGIVDAAAEVESPNLLTNSYITKYLYTSTESIDFDNLVGKDVTVEVDGIAYSINFVYNNQLVFVGRYTGLSEYNFADENLLGWYGEGMPLVQVSSKGNMIVCSYSYTVDETSKIPTISWTIYHTSDGVIFNRLPDIDGIISMPKISRTGNYCFVFKQDGPYVYSLLATEDSGNGQPVLKYPTWQNLLNKINSTEYAALKLSINNVNTTGEIFNQSVIVNGDFYDDIVFAFTYGDGLIADSKDPIYNSLYCIYSKGSGHILQEKIFYSLEGSTKTYSPVSTKYSVAKITYGERMEIGGEIYPHIVVYKSTNIAPPDFTYVNKEDDSDRLYYKFENLVFHKNGNKANELAPDTFTRAELSGKLTVYDANNEIISSKTLRYVNSNFNFITPYDPNDESTSNSRWIIEDTEFPFKYIIDTSIAGETIYQDFRLTAKDVSGSTTGVTKKVPIATGVECAANTNYYMPNVYVSLKADPEELSILIDFSADLIDAPTPYSSCYRGTYLIVDGETTLGTMLSYRLYSTHNYRTPLKDGCFIKDNKYTLAYLSNDNGVQNIQTETITRNGSTLTKKIATIFSEALGDKFYDTRLIFSYPSGYLLTNDYFFDYTDYIDTSAQYTPLKLLFSATPVAYYYYGTELDSMYLATNNALYTSNSNKVITVSEVTKLDNNYFLPSFYTLLSNYYLSKGNELYISAPSYTLDIESNGTLKRTKGTFKWYFPEIAKQTFDYNITNLHVISDTDVAIFFEHSVSLVRWDSEAAAYVYYNSKLQAGCKMGCDVLTTYDGKYVVFTSGRGLVAMTYQEFMATTEQTLQYLSDTIYSVYNKYITEPMSTNHIKLFKYGYWIAIYKPDSNKGFLFDIRNNSWWPITSLHNVKKMIQHNDKVELLSDGSMYDLSTLETDYFDNDGKKHKIPWLLESQKLYLNAPNYYKHIINLTFMSVHDTQLLQNARYNVDELNFKLQVNNYRKRINGNIGSEDDYAPVNYKVESIRTYVQRLNYSKVNEFEYLLSSDEDNAIDIPLSLSSITIKYKIGSQVR